jgi:TPR repeat protein
MLVPAIVGGAIFGWVVGKGINQYRNAPPPEVKMEELLKKADGGDVTAQFSSGMAYHLGQGDFEQSAEHALKYFRMAAAQDSAQKALAASKEPTAEQEAAAKAENTAQAHALYCIGIYYLAGTGIEKDEAAAVGYFKQSAEKGLANAQLQLSQCYFDAIGVPQADAAEGVRWLRAAAEKDSLDAMHRLGICISQGHGVEGGKDPAGAVTLWEKAAEKGHAGSELQLGQAYFTGAGVEETDTKKAMELWESAASKGDTEAVYLLGLCYTGVGIGGENAVEKDLAAVRKRLLCLAIFMLKDRMFAKTGSGQTQEKLKQRDISAGEKVLRDRCRSGRLTCAAAASDADRRGAAGAKKTPCF